MNENNREHHVSAIPVEHPMGEFYLTALPAGLLVNCTFSDPVKDFEDGLLGLERRIDQKRVKEIGAYIQTYEAVFPGTIILAANWLQGNERLPEDDERAWRVEVRGEELADIIIPYDDVKVTAIVDGQHRVNGFRNIAMNPSAIKQEDVQRLMEMKLPCAVFFGLTPPQQATVFATINYNQKQVNKSLTYRLFGYNLQEEKSEHWTPEKLAVFLARKLNIDEDSPFKGHVKVAAIDGRLVSENRDTWVVSVATIVEGFLSLYSRNPKRDRDTMLLRRSSTRDDLKALEDDTPLRDDYIKGYDGLIYDCVKNYFNVVCKKLWCRPENGVLHKTAGVQALFSVLVRFVLSKRNAGDVREPVWEQMLEPLWRKNVAFTDPLLTETSARGRSRIVETILVALDSSRLNIVNIKDEKFFDFLKGIADR